LGQGLAFFGEDKLATLLSLTSVQGAARNQLVASAHCQLVKKLMAHAHCQLKPGNYGLLTNFIPDGL